MGGAIVSGRAEQQGEIKFSRFILFRNCHPERSEGPAFLHCRRKQILPFAQDDSPKVTISQDTVSCGDVPEWSRSIAALTLADTASVSRSVIPVVDIGWPTRISSGRLLMW
jgi:hypothetical protein